MKLNQAIAVERSIKKKATSANTELYKGVQKPALFDGFSKTYQPKDEDGEQQPPEAKRVQLRSRSVIETSAEVMTELFDVTATKDWGNCVASADVIVDGETILPKVPATYLLFLEKQLTDFHTLVAKIPTLDPAEEWEWDGNASVFRSKETQTGRTKKVQKPIVMYDATKEHPAQTQLITEDVLVGNWSQTKFSGAMKHEDKERLLGRIEKLQKAVKFAREDANSTTVDEVKVGEKVFYWLVGQ